MNKVHRDFIEYNGINTDSNTTLKNFNQLHVNYNLRISDEKTDIQTINKVWVNSHIDYQEVIKTPIGKSLHGHISTGYKLLVTGEIDVKIEYYSGGYVEVLHTAQGSFPFCNYITLPLNFDTSSMIQPSSYIEDMFSEVLNNRTIYNSISLILSADLG